jgi:hypothetical protein
MSGQSALDSLLRAFAAGEIAPNMALARLITRANSEREVESALRCFEHAGGPIDELRQLWVSTPDAFRAVRDVHRLGTASPDEQVRWAEVFDAAAAINPQAAVAVYSLGRPDLLARATSEIVQ